MAPLIDTTELLYHYLIYAVLHRKYEKKDVGFETPYVHATSVPKGILCSDPYWKLDYSSRAMVS